MNHPKFYSDYIRRRKHGTKQGVHADVISEDTLTNIIDLTIEN